MTSKRLLLALAVIGGVALLFIIGLVLSPQSTNPAIEVATTFANAAASGDDATAFPLLDDTLQTYVRENCPEGSVSACIQSYIPQEWGGLIKAVFRRAAPDGARAWNVDLIATYEKDKGFSGVCMYQRVEQLADGQWKVTGWAGFLWCGDPASRNMATNPDTPNRAP